jgi:hypothetical protein
MIRLPARGGPSITLRRGSDELAQARSTLMKRTSPVWAALTALTALLSLVGQVSAQNPQTIPNLQSMTPAPSAAPVCLEGAWTAHQDGRGFLESDRAFPGFVGPITNPILTKDPRSLTEARLLFINNQIDPGNPLGAGDFQVAAMELRFALTERLTLVADKDGYAWIHAANQPEAHGFLNFNFGLKYDIVRDVENQFLVAVGGTWEPQTGEGRVFQDIGTGIFTVFGVIGKEFGGCNHVLFNAGYQFPADPNQNSSFFYTQLHLDRQFFGWLYPLVELNWFHYTEGGDHGLPPSLGELDGLINLGTSGVSGNDLVTLAVGMKAQLSPHADTGFAFEVPISNRHDFLNNRLIVELILRY